MMLPARVSFSKMGQGQGRPEAAAKDEMPAIKCVFHVHLTDNTFKEQL